MSLKKLAESRIVIDPEVCSGKARIKGTKVTVADIILSMAEGLSHTEILRNYRSIQADDIKACLAYSYCQNDGIKLNIKSAFGAAASVGSEIEAGASVEQEDSDLFSIALEQQASIQEEITQEKIKEIQEEKTRNLMSTPDGGFKDEPKKSAPKSRNYDLMIDITPEATATKVFADVDEIEQALDMKKANYLFLCRSDSKPWLTYSIKDGVEIDQAMKRNLMVTYKHKGKKIKAVFEGYLTTDRQNKVFLELDPKGEVCGQTI